MKRDELVGRDRPGLPEWADPDIRILTPEDVGSLRLHWDARFTPRELRELAASGENISVWNTRTGEYLIGGSWRHRQEIATILELGATAGAIDLINGFAAVGAQQGVELIMVSEQAERRRPEFYESAGLDLVEEIVVYELVRVRSRSSITNCLRFEPFDTSNQAVFSELLRLDHAAFPWLWWNSRGEFIDYAKSPGVQIQVAYDDAGQMVAYIGTTRFRSWGHLDRIAVDPHLQGRGLGRTALDYAVTWLANSGARRVGLSTQSRNTRSRRLYETYGFRRAPSHDYRLYGRHLTHSTDRDMVRQAE